MSYRTIISKARPLLIALAFLSCFAAAPALAAPQLSLFSDFDGDHKVDRAELLSHGAEKQIDVTLGAFRFQSLTFNSGIQDRGQLVCDDIDRDGDADLVWISQTQPRKFVMWLGDGRGNFSVVADTAKTDFLEVLGGNKTQLSAEDDICESIGLIQSPTIVHLATGSAIAPAVCVRQVIIVLPAHGDWSESLSLFRKRGPPPRLS